MLISDDDIIIEGAVKRIIHFLRAHPDVSLAYLDAVAFRDQYTGVENCHGYKYLSPVEADKVTTDKDEFLHYCRRLFGFTSVYIWATDRVHAIENPEQYFETYFLQCYITVLCSNRGNDQLGLIHGPCVAVGEYSIVGNYDLAQVEGVYYKKMMEFAIQNGYPRKPLEEFFMWKICYLGFYTVLKEKSLGIHNTSIRTLFDLTKKSPYAWTHLYPAFLVPGFISRWAITVRHKLHKRNVETRVNRPTEENQK